MRRIWVNTVQMVVLCSNNLNYHRHINTHFDSYCSIIDPCRQQTLFVVVQNTEVLYLFRDWSLITGRGGYKTVKFYPYEKCGVGGGGGGQNSLCFGKIFEFLVFSLFSVPFSLFSALTNASDTIRNLHKKSFKNSNLNKITHYTLTAYVRMSFAKR